MMPTQIERVAVERAASLFEKRRLSDIRAIEAATLKQIEDKRTQLRSLVGGSYGDVIRTADAVLEMSAQSGVILHDLEAIQATFEKPTEELESKGEPLEMDDGMLALGSRVKYVMDVQEAVWSALDSGGYLEAARRILKGEMVLEGLMRNSKENVLQTFPFVEHLRPGMVQLKSHVLDQAKQELSTKTGTEVESVAICLAAVISLENITSTDALRLYLRQRKLHLIKLSTDATTSTPDSILISIGQAIQQTILHVSQLFIRSIGEDTEMPLQTTLIEDSFGFGGSLMGQLGDISESDAWHSQLDTRSSSFGSVKSTDIAQILQSWLEDVADTIHEAGQGLLLSCHDLTSLSEIEASVKATLTDTSIERTMQETLGTQTELWKVVFESIIQEKCLSLLSEAFATASGQLLSVVQKTKTALGMHPQPQTSLLHSVWRPRHIHEAGDGDGDENLEHGCASPSIVMNFDRMLGEILRQLMGLLSVRERHGQGDHSPTSVRHGSVRSFSLLSGTQPRAILFRKTERSTELEPKIQSLWETTALNLAQELDSVMPEMQIEGALFVGTVSMGLAESCPNVGILAGPSDEWRSETVPRSTRSSMKPDTAAPPHLGDAFRRVAFKGTHLWLDWAINRLVSDWKAAVEKLTGQEILQAVTIAHDAEAMGDHHMEFSIPSHPSEATVKLMVEASLELGRLGHYANHPQILHLFQFKLEEAIRGILEAMTFQSVPSDNYILQLLMDFRFVRDICSDGSPVPSFDAESSDVHRSLSIVPEDTISLHDSGHRHDPVIKRAIHDSHRRSEALEASLSDQLDPIDWATYEPHLWLAERRSYRRTLVLLGNIGHCHRPLHASASVKLPNGSVTNCLYTAPVAARFQYLPVRPTMGDTSQRSASAMTYAALVEDDDPSGNYTFSDLARTNIHDATTPQVDVGAFSSLGTMFTDKAAEMSALAQQRIEQFGDYLQPSGLASSSLFSSFAKRSTASPTKHTS